LSVGLHNTHIFIHRNTVDCRLSQTCSSMSRKIATSGSAYSFNPQVHFSLLIVVSSMRECAFVCLCSVHSMFGGFSRRVRTVRRDVFSICRHHHLLQSYPGHAAGDSRCPSLRHPSSSHRPSASSDHQRRRSGPQSSQIYEKRYE